ncbi:hypothetical protein [Tumebacillus flagellatus]|uniref:Uncharacterized protein n=1 Tax=Tumebacillus flagellatus TaxID=1157490 RepID=A0A074LIJ7_9BACL|nr:hypothetical protein [Tumebacillus flagellatus]KEO80969.1 hypothetical protein EL26_23375 [Tumebacillus flagellatus]
MSTLQQAVAALASRIEELAKTDEVFDTRFHSLITATAELAAVDRGIIIPPAPDSTPFPPQKEKTAGDAAVFEGSMIDPKCRLAPETRQKTFDIGADSSPSGSTQCAHK